MYVCLDSSQQSTECMPFRSQPQTNGFIILTLFSFAYGQHHVIKARWVSLVSKRVRKREKHSLVGFSMWSHKTAANHCCRESKVTNSPVLSTVSKVLVLLNHFLSYATHCHVLLLNCKK